MTPSLVKRTGEDVLGGLIFGFHTAVIAGTTQQLTVVYNLTSFTLGLTVFIGLAGTVIGAMSARVVGPRIRGREALRSMGFLLHISPPWCPPPASRPPPIAVPFTRGT